MLSKDSVAWRLKPLMDDQGALTVEQIAYLSNRHDFPVPDVEKLSTGLSIALDPTRYLVRDESKEFLRDKAVKEVQALAVELEKAEVTLAAIRSRLDSIVFKAASPMEWLPNPVEPHLASLNATIVSMASFKKFLLMMAREQLLSMRNMPDKRRLKDERLRIVCLFIFDFWQDHGRNFSYTTDPGTSGRGGALIDFVNGLIGCISYPPGSLGGEAIKTQIEYFKTRADRTATV